MSRPFRPDITKDVVAAWAVRFRAGESALSISLRPGDGVLDVSDTTVRKRLANLGIRRRGPQPCLARGDAMRAEFEAAVARGESFNGFCLSLAASPAVVKAMERGAGKKLRRGSRELAPIPNEVNP